MKTISVRQPWAWCLFHGKPVENRDYMYPWSSYRGLIWIHASAGCGKQEYADAVDWIRHGVRPDFYVPTLAELPRGCVVGTAFLDRVVTRYESPWFCGKYGLVFKDAQELTVPLPAKGMLGLWEWEEANGTR